MSPWLTTKHQNSQQSPGRNFNKLRLFWKEVSFCPISQFPLSSLLKLLTPLWENRFPFLIHPVKLAAHLFKFGDLLTPVLG